MPSRTAYSTSGSLGWYFLLVLLSALQGLTPAAGSELRRSPIVKAVQSARLSVVNIRGEKMLDPAATQSLSAEGNRRVNGMGTGVVIDHRGYIVTNYHVVEGVREIQVTTADGERYVGRLLIRDPKTDLAIIKIDPPGEIPAMAMGTSSGLMPGETVIAVGNAYGYEHTVTRGIVSALHRAVKVSDAQFYNDLIQTDASINPGNSGGPLLNIDGKMIGINVAVRAGAQGIGFAIPADQVLGVASALLASQNEAALRHGIVAETAACSAAGPGMVIGAVEAESPAAQARLQSGDLITQIDDLKIQGPFDFQRSLLERKPGDTLAVTVRRGGKLLHQELCLDRAPDGLSPPASQPAWEILGLDLKPLTPAERQILRATRFHGGLAVTAVRSQSPAAQQGIQPGDILVGMHTWETVSLDNVAYILKRPDFANLTPLKFYILRGSDTLYGYLPLPVKTAQRP
ncbi:MAG: trypsin-like peptidase domain-containing protein [Pirellulales bacterium]|nr:trypsin-like peptidase domain-containing protein [Pirellulales bacterium]